MADGHAATPNSNCGSVPSQAGKSTDPANLKAQMTSAMDASEDTKVVETSPGV